MNPLVISYFTPQYGPDSVQLAATLDEFHIEHDIVPVEGHANWRKNVGLKPGFILKKLTEHQRAVVWLDADARARVYPELFDELGNIDFAAYFIPKDEMNKKDRPLPERGPLDAIASGTMYWNNTNQSLVFLDEWIEREKGQYRYGQTVLGEAWHLHNHEETGLRTQRLPQSYTKVFDGAWKKGESKPVVIEHMQSSRKYRRNTR